MTDVLRSWHVQRLHKPRGYLDMPLSMPSVSKEVSEVLGKVFTLDYMGAAEFEFGAVPKTLVRIAKRGGLHAGKIDVQIMPSEYEIKSLDGEVAYHERWAKDEPEDAHGRDELARAKAHRESASKPQNPVIYILAPEYLMDYAKKFVADEAQNSQHLKEPTWFRDSFVGRINYSENVGWLEMDNGFIFFSDWVMFNGTAELFEVKHAFARPEAQQPTPPAGTVSAPMAQPTP